MGHKPKNPTDYLTVTSLLEKAAENGCNVSYRKLRYWQACGIVPYPLILPGFGHVGYYTEDVVKRLIMVARARRSHKDLKKLDRRPIREVMAVLNGNIPEMLEIIDYQDMTDGRQACILRDGSILVRSKK